MKELPISVTAEAGQLEEFMDIFQKHSTKPPTLGPAQKNSDQLNLDFTSPEVIKAVLEAAVVLNSLVIALLGWFKKPNRRKIIVKTPFGSCTFEASADMTEEQVREKLKAILSL